MLTKINIWTDALILKRGMALTEAAYGLKIQIKHIILVYVRVLGKTTILNLPSSASIVKGWLVLTEYNSGKEIMQLQ